MVKNAIKNIFLMGVGAASITKKKAQETVKVFVKKGVIDNKQAKEVIDRIMREAGKVKDKLKKEGAKEVKKVKKKISVTKTKAVRRVSGIVNKAARKVARKGMKL